MVLLILMSMGLDISVRRMMSRVWWLVGVGIGGWLVVGMFLF